MRILIIEDDVSLARALEQILRENNYEAEAVHDGKIGLEWARSGQYDAIILDIMLPSLSGFDVVSALRQAGVSTPVLLLSALGEVDDKIKGLDSGADDYMTKPFSPAELLAHLRMFERRQGEVVFETCTFKDLSLDLNSHDLKCGEKQIPLSYKEFCLMKYFILNAGQTVSKEMLIDKVWGYESYAGDNNVEAYISFVRKKLKFLKSETKIETLRKAGYRLV